MEAGTQILQRLCLTQDVGSPEKLITGFAPELFGVPIAEEDVLETASVTKDGHCYYQWCGSASESRLRHGMPTVPTRCKGIPHCIPRGALLGLNSRGCSKTTM